MIAQIASVYREAMNIDKRILIRGEGLLGESKIDQRANAPTFRIRRSCLIHDIDLDMTGFRECISVEGAAYTKALIMRCRIKCGRLELAPYVPFRIVQKSHSFLI